MHWMEIKLKEENIQADKLNIFVETKFKSPDTKQSGFWAIDNVRVCNENGKTSLQVKKIITFPYFHTEVKVSYLKLNDMNVDDEKENYISCQLIKKPSWRPKRLVYNKIKGRKIKMV